jgi:putative serine/threonine protein kinase
VKLPIIVTTEELNMQPYASILCFPNPNDKELQSRLQELRSLGVSALEFSGEASLFGIKVPVLGKGFVGIVVIAYVRGVKVAVKILRHDAGRADLLHEAAMLQQANSVDVGPKLIGASKDFLVMQLIEGELLPNWLEKTSDKSMVKKVLGQILEQGWRLDKAGLDHGELSKAPKHLLVDKAENIFMVDFETASTERHVSNVTAVCQYLFAGNSSASRYLAETLGQKDMAQLVAALKAYKKNRSRENFESLCNVCLS